MATILLILSSKFNTHTPGTAGHTDYYFRFAVSISAVSLVLNGLTFLNLTTSGATHQTHCLPTYIQLTLHGTFGTMECRKSIFLAFITMIGYVREITRDQTAHLTTCPKIVWSLAYFLVIRI